MLLRFSTVAALLFECYFLRLEISGVVQAVAVLTSIAIGAGYLTPIAAIVALATHVVIWFALDSVSLAAATVVTLDALALALLGPGAYSIDAYRFGRRLVVLPPA